ncbi:hypothetical protein PVAG01_09610 [Phlyctema vagabunda]|uniref:Uncharacterized protein n=1 Tax=Phlyctema vagabunda TaxID=108571 RepID=A0ABR4P7U8_9HELO
MFDEQDRRVIQALLDRVGALERQVELNRQNELERIRAQQEQSARARLLQSLPLTQPQLFPFGPVMYGGQLDMNPGDPRLAIRDAPVRGRSRSPDLHFSSSYRARSPLAQQRDSAHRLPSATQADSSRTGLTSARAQEKGRTTTHPNALTNTSDASVRNTPSTLPWNANFHASTAARPATNPSTIPPCGARSDAPFVETSATQPSTAAP